MTVIENVDVTVYYYLQHYTEYNCNAQLDWAYDGTKTSCHYNISQNSEQQQEWFYQQQYYFKVSVFPESQGPKGDVDLCFGRTVCVFMSLLKF